MLTTKAVSEESMKKIEQINGNDYKGLSNTEVIDHGFRDLLLRFNELIKWQHEMVDRWEAAEDVSKLLIDTKKDKVSSKWQPKEGEYFWSIQADGALRTDLRTAYVWEDALVDFGNCFETEEEAREMRDKIKILFKGEK